VTKRQSALRAVGKSSCVIGALLLAFVGYQLWGTSLSEHSAQSRLRSELNAQLHHHLPISHSASTSTTSGGDGPEGDTLGSSAGDTAVAGSPALGAPVGFLSIPRIGMSDDVIVEGVGTDQLRQGPGHYPGTPLPGQPGNVAIAGHRTTYAAPFYNLNELQAGDPITIQTVLGTFHYVVTQSNTVSPTDSAVLDSTGPSELTLTTCNPRYSATQRLIVVALLQGSDLGGTGHPAGTTKTTKATRNPSRTELADNGAGGSVGGAVLWGLLTASVTLAVWALWRRLRSPGRWGVLTLGTPAVLVVLFIFFGHVSAVLPASF
jgi:sortase A